MKKSLGSLLFLFLVPLMATSQLCDVNFTVSNPKPYVKEPVIITFHAAQKDHKEVMFFDLSIDKSPLFTLTLLEKKEHEVAYHDKYVTYTYQLFPLKEGNLTLPFKLKVSTASDKSVETFATGSRDVINPMLTDDYDIPIKALHLFVKPIKAVDLVGDFTLKMQIDKKILRPFEQLNLNYTLQGKGYPANIPNLLPKIEGVEIFLEKNHPNKETDIYQYALIADKNFTIPALKLHCFSPKKRRYYTLQTNPTAIKVKAISQEALLDKHDSLPSTVSNFDWKNLFYALLIFIAGYLSATLHIFDFLKKSTTVDNPLKDDITQSKNPKALLQLLLSTKNRDYKPYIDTLEAHLYHDKPIDFKALKEQLLKLT